MIQRWTAIGDVASDPNGALVRFEDLKIKHGGLVLDRLARTVTQNGQPTPLSPREFALLEYLLLRVGEACPVSELHEALWPGKPTDTNVVNVYINYLRVKLGRELIRTMPHKRGFIIE